jgi:hypothetical protein
VADLGEILRIEQAHLQRAVVSAPRTSPISRLNSPARTYRCRRFACALAGADARLAATVGRYSFGAGLSHSHLNAGLSRRTMTRGINAAMDLVTLMMTRKMLLGIKARASSTSRPPPRAPDRRNRPLPVPPIRHHGAARRAP